MSKCVSSEIHEQNIYISNDDLNTEILMKQIFYFAMFFLEENFVIIPLCFTFIENIILCSFVALF